MGLTIKGGKTEGVPLVELEVGDCFKYEEQLYQLLQENDELQQPGDGNLLAYSFEMHQVAKILATALVNPVALTLEVTLG